MITLLCADLKRELEGGERTSVFFEHRPSEAQSAAPEWPYPQVYNQQHKQQAFTPKDHIIHRPPHVGLGCCSKLRGRLMLKNAQEEGNLSFIKHNFLLVCNVQSASSSLAQINFPLKFCGGDFILCAGLLKWYTFSPNDPLLFSFVANFSCFFFFRCSDDLQLGCSILPCNFLGLVNILHVSDRHDMPGTKTPIH